MPIVHIVQEAPAVLGGHLPFLVVVVVLRLLLRLLLLLLRRATMPIWLGGSCGLRWLLLCRRGTVGRGSSSSSRGWLVATTGVALTWDAEVANVGLGGMQRRRAEQHEGRLQFRRGRRWRWRSSMHARRGGCARRARRFLGHCP